MSKIRPLGDRIAIKAEEAPSKTEGGIEIPDTAKDKPTKGEVVAVGEGKLLDDGTRSVPSVAVGDRVMFGIYTGTDIELDGEKLKIMREEDVLVVLEAA